jgi:hypothetical protein
MTYVTCPPMSAAVPERHRRLSRAFTSRLLPNPTRHGPPQTDSLTSVSPKRAKSESRGRSNGATIDQSYMLLPAMFEHSSLSIPVVRVSRQPLRVTSCLGLRQRGCTRLLKNNENPSKRKRPRPRLPQATSARKNVPLNHIGIFRGRTPRAAVGRG